MMDDDQRSDFISDLPQSILESILTKLPIRDTVRTSTLSRRWRYKWTTITSLVFNDKCASPPYDRAITDQILVNFITRFLFLHDGPIHEFSLSTSFLENSPDIDQWLLFLSRKDIKKLHIELGEGEWFRAPSCLFAFSKLTHLELIRCELDRPPNFKGFLCLKYLNLQQVLMPPDDIEIFISSCPLLESLTLSYFDSLELTICAPNLKHLILEGEFMDICLENTPHLVVVSVAMYMTDDRTEHLKNSSICNFDKFLGGLPCLERLVGQIYFTKYLSIGIDRESNPIKYDHLKIVELYQVNFEDLNEVLAVLRLIVSSPNLVELQISGSSNATTAKAVSDLGFWEKECSLDYTFDQLRTVKITEVCGTLHEMGFIKFLLSHAPVLEVMTVAPCGNVADERCMLVKLLNFQRASAQAKVIYVPEQL